MHAAAVVLEDWLRHERHRFSAAFRDVLADVLVPHELIGHLDQRLELHVDFRLAGRGDLVMVRLDDDPDLLHLGDHLASQVVVGVGRADGKVASLEAWLVAKVRLLDARRVPRAFPRVNLVVAPVLVLLVADLIEDEELRLGPDEAGVGNPRLLQVLLGFARDMARVPRELLPGDGIDHVGDHAHRRLGKERIDASGGGVRHGHHVGLVDAHPAANRRAVEPETLLEGAFIQNVHRKRAMLPAPEHVDELQVDHLGLVLLGVGKEVFGVLREIVRRHRCSSPIQAESGQGAAGRFVLTVTPGRNEPGEIYPNHNVHNTNLRRGSTAGARRRTESSQD